MLHFIYYPLRSWENILLILWILSENAQKPQEEVVAYKLQDTVLYFDENK